MAPATLPLAATPGAGAHADHPRIAQAIISAGAELNAD
jgi:hypothetical protein